MPENEQQQPSYPLTNVQITPHGLVINTMINSACTIGQLIEANIMDQICIDWPKSRKPPVEQLAVVRNGNIQPLRKKR